MFFIDNATPNSPPTAGETVDAPLFVPAPPPHLPKNLHSALQGVVRTESFQLLQSSAHKAVGVV